MNRKQILDKIDKLIKEYKDAHLKAKYDDLSDLHNDAMVENMEARALRFIELATDKDSVFRKQAYFHDGRNKRINELIGILYAVKEEISDDSESINAEDTKEKKYNLLHEKFECETTELKDNKKYKCFVIMPIGKEGTIEYENNLLVFNGLIKPCVEKSGYDIECYHSDLITETGAISKQVIHSLKNDDIVIADLRRRNPNVLYELGVRHTFRKRSILVCSNHSENPFHTSNYRAVSYKLDGSSNQDFFKRLSKLVDDIIKNPNKNDNPVTDILGEGVLKDYRKNEAVKKLHLSRKWKGMYSLGELYNSSNEDFIDCNITLDYIDKNKRQINTKGRVIDAMEDPLHARPSDLGLLKAGEIKHIVDFPRTQVSVTITGKSLSTDKKFEEKFEINPKQEQ